MKNNALIQYFKGSVEELRKVTWPTKNQALKLTTIVIGFCIAMAILLGLFDYLFSLGYSYLLNLS